MQDISNYNKIREDANNFYQKIRAIRCPAWITNHYRDIKLISQAKGNLGED